MRSDRDDGAGIAMPFRAPSIRGCGCILRSGETCQHQRARKAEADKHRPSARQRGYDTSFQRAAFAFLKDHRFCTCGAPAVLVRHRVSIRQRPDLRMDRSNWLPGCRRCNAQDVQRERREGRGVSQNFSGGAWDRWGRSPRDRDEMEFSARVTK